MSITLATYESSRGQGLQHTVMQGSDGVVYCSCTGWKFKKNCKHLLDFTINKAQNALQVFDKQDRESSEERKQTVNQLDGDHKVADAVQIAIQMMRS